MAVGSGTIGGPGLVGGLGLEEGADMLVQEFRRFMAILRTAQRAEQSYLAKSASVEEMIMSI